jgi:WhiB family redox-sensing transcriptional regulator
MDDRKWRDRAACRSADPETFFGNDYAPARAVCEGCPVRLACLEDALTVGDIEHGIRAGMTPRERRDLRREWDRTGPPALPPIRRTRQAATPMLTAAEMIRFERKLRPAGACRLWTGGVDRRKGLPRLHLNRADGEAHAMAHRVAFLLHYGRQPEGPVQQVCGNSLCCAGEHLVDGAEAVGQAAA